MPGESHVLQEIRARLGQRHDLRLIRINAAVLRNERGRPIRTVSVNGCPDTFGILAVHGVGVFVGIEAKAPGERQSPEQVIAQQVIEGMGGIYIVAHSGDEAEQALEQARLVVLRRMRRPQTP